MTEIETSRLLLRPWRNEDLAPYARICTDPEVMRYLSGAMTPKQSEEQVSAFVRHWKERGFGLWAVEEKSSATFIGFIGLLYHEEWPEGEHKTEVGWRLDRSFWGRGLATEGARASLHYGFEEPRHPAYVGRRSLDRSAHVGSLCVARALSAAC